MSQDELDKHEKKCKSIRLLYDEFKKNKFFSSDYIGLKNFCLKEDIQNYFIEYSKYISNIIYNSEEEYKNLFDNFVLPLKILDINLNDDNSRIIYNITYDANIDPSNYFSFEDTFYMKYFLGKKEIDYVSDNNNYKKEIIDIINNEDFLKDFYEILGSKNVSYFLKNKRSYDNHNELGVIFIYDDKNPKKDTQCLKEQYEQFMKDAKNDNYNLLKKIIRVKGLSYQIPAATGPSMRICLNPILSFSQQAIIDGSQRHSILKSALIILLLHEIVHFLKYYPVENKYPKETPFTPKGRENGKCLIYYLFGIGKVTLINTNQSELINNTKTWDSLEKLKEIFIEESKQPLDSKIGELDLFISESQEGDEGKYKNRKRTDYCFW